MNSTLEQQLVSDLSNWKNLIKPYAKANNRKAFWNLVNTFVPFLSLLKLAVWVYPSSVSLSIATALLAGLFLNRIFIIQHDCGHQSYTESRCANQVIGTICSLFSFIPFSYWAKSHNHHHAHQGQLDHRSIGDITVLTVEEYNQLNVWERWKYKLYRSLPVMFFLGPLYYIFIHNRLPLISFKGWEKEKKALMFTNIALFVFHGGIGMLVGWKIWALVYFCTVISFAVMAIWLFYIQHQHDPNYKAWKGDWNFLVAAIRGSSYYDMPRWLHFFSGNIGYHHLHHLSPKIPFYHLSLCSRENPVFQKYVTRLTFWSSLKCIFHALWDEKQQKMVSFASYYRSQKS